MGDSSGGGRGGGAGKDAGSKAAVASQAQSFYSVGKYEKALECLQRLATQMGEKDDPRVQCNLVLTEHAKGGFKRPLVIRDRLGAIRNSLKERSNRTGAAARAAKDALRLKGQGAAGGEGEDDEGYGDALEEEEDEVDTTDTDTSILLYNLAALHFHEKQYGAAQQILHGLFARVEVLEEALGVHVCFLLLDVLLHSARGSLHTDKDRERFAQHTAALLAYLERPHTFGPPTQPTSGGDGAGEGVEGGAVAGGKSLEMTEFAFRLHLYKAKVRLLQGEVKASKKDLKSALEMFQRELRPTPSDGGAIGGSRSGGGGGDSDDEDASAAAAAASSSTGSTLMGGHDASLPPADVANVAALYLKANLEYLRLNFRKALKLLASCQKGEAGRLLPAGTSCYLNDMGVLHAKMGLPAVALQYFQRALACCDDASPLSPSTNAAPGGQRPLGADGRVLPHALCETVYNTGLQLLLLGRYPQAFRCFENASLLFYNRPRLWLRMAECCVQQHRLEERRRGGAVRDRLVRRVVGQGRHRRVVLPVSGEAALREMAAAGAATAAGAGAAAAPGAGSSGAGKGGAAKAAGAAAKDVPNGKGKGGKGESTAAAADEAAAGEGLRGECSLRYAVKCLQNVLFLLSIASQGGGRNRLHVTLGGAKAAMLTGGGGDAEASQAQPPQPPAAPQQQQQVNDAENGAGGGGGAATGLQDESLLEQAALLNLAYVHLCLQEPVLALQCAEAVLGRCGAALSDGKRVTARTYAAEALCALGRPGEALLHLLPEGQPLPEAAAVAALGEQRQGETARHVLTADSFLPAEHFAARARSALHLNLANVYLLQNDLPMAERCVRAGLAACPTSPDALRSLVFVLLREGQTAAALEVLKSRRPTAVAAGMDG